MSPSIRILRSIALSSAQIFARAPTNLLDRLPCLKCAAAILARPSAVRGPVLKPPCSRQRFLPRSGGFWHAVPRRVLAPQRMLGQSGPTLVFKPISTLLFITLKTLPHMGIFYTPFMVEVRGTGDLVPAL